MNKAFKIILIGALFIAYIMTAVACSKQVDPRTGQPLYGPGSKSDMEKAADVCKNQGKTLASYEEKDYDFKFTCE